MTSTLGENSKEPSSSAMSTEASFNDSNTINVKIGYKSYSNITYPSPTKSATANVGEGLQY